jgi:MFS family permease
MSDRSQFGDSTAGSQLPEALRAFRHRQFQIMYGGEAISLLGTWMQQIALSWLIFRLTGSSLLLGSVAFAGQIPNLLLAPLGGVVADRYSRRKILIVVQSIWVVQALVLAALTLTNTVEVWQIFVLSVVSGVLFAFDMPARQAFVVDLVGKEDLPNAIALNNSLVNGATVAGPVFASMLVAKVSEGACFFANGISKIFVVISLIMIKVNPVPQPSHRKSPIDDVLEGFRWARGSRPAKAIFWLLAIIGLLGMPVTVLMPVVASNMLNNGPTALGILMGAYGVGALLGSVPLAFRKNAQGLTHWMTYSAAALGMLFVAFAGSRDLWLSALLLVPAGACLILVINISITLIQTIAPEKLRGRAMSLHLMIFMGLSALGSFLMGLFAEYIGVAWTIAVCGVGSLMGAAAFFYSMRDLHAAVDALVVEE